MSHDFDEKHGGNGDYTTSTNDCNGKGIMSYGEAPNTWSTCSVADFSGYYQQYDWGCTCLTGKLINWIRLCKRSIKIIYNVFEIDFPGFINPILSKYTT